MVANEVVNLLRAIGILSQMSDTMLGMTVLAWGNSIGGELVHSLAGVMRIEIYALTMGVSSSL